VDLFERIAAVVSSDLVSERVARRIVAELRTTQAGADGQQRVLLRIVDDLPGLEFLVPALSFRPTTLADRAQMVRASGMLLTIVSARARQLESAGERPLGARN
jgi:hypothetical protein